jgi:hypothetical protein
MSISVHCGEMNDNQVSSSRAAHTIVYLVAGVTGPVLLLLTDNITAVFSPGYNPFTMTISTLALGPLGWLLRTGFFLFGILLIVETIGLNQSIRGGWMLHVAIIIFIAIGLAFFFLGSFKTDPPLGTHTVHGMIHLNVARTVALLFPIVCLLMGLVFKADPNWRGLFTYTMVTAAMATALDITRLAIPSRLTWLGFYERLILWNALIWLEVVAVRFWQITNRAGKIRETLGVYAFHGREGAD